METPACPSPTIVIFGATGDLTRRKLIPALFRLIQNGRLATDTNIVCFARRPLENAAFRADVKQALKEFAKDAFTEKAWKPFASQLTYFHGNLTIPADFARLAEHLSKLENGKSIDRLYYLAISPEFYESTIKSLGAAGMAAENGAKRSIIIEKPFGVDFASANALNICAHRVFSEEQIFRIDHYLGKETAQNILFFRFANTIFEPVWNRRYIDHVQITVAEEVDVDQRAGYYDKSGILRDMFQNHLLQLLTLVAMEPPYSFEANALRNEKVKVLHSIRKPLLSDLVLGQYAGYTRAKGVAPKSKTPTFAALKLYIDSWRWQGVPFYLRSGKALKRKTSEIAVVFNCPPRILFNMSPDEEMTSNILSMCIQPDEGFHLRFETKVPGSGRRMRSVDMEFHYQETFGKNALPEAYERLIHDALLRDASLFARSDEIETAWKLIDPLVSANQKKLTPHWYDPGSWGPDAAMLLIDENRRTWREGCSVHNVHLHDLE